MSFRHTYVTEFFYKHGLDKELAEIKSALEKYGTANWHGRDNLGYFHGVVKDLDSHETKSAEAEILADLEAKGIRIKIVYE